VPAIDVSNSK